MPQQQFESEKRYDEETVQKILAAAGRLQQEHKETLSAEQVEAIGQEVGLEPVFIRRVLAQMEQQQQTVSTPSAASIHDPTLSEERHPVSPMVAATVGGVVFFFIVILAARQMALSPLLMLWVIFCGVLGVILFGSRRSRERRSRR